MIKFFRNIRRRLLRENRFTRYLIYAIGEIILVVIGILIALQINNWNEQRKAQRLEKNFFENVLVDLYKDEQKLAYYEMFYEKRIEYLDTLLTYVRDPSRVMGVEKFGMYAEPIFYSANPNNYSSTFESAKAMGTFANFENKELVKDLSEYYADFILIEYAFNSTLRFVENQYDPLMYIQSYMNENTGDLVINEEEVKSFYQKIASIKDTRNITPDYNSILQNPKMENYIIGDLGRSYNALGKVNSRQIMLKALIEKIENL